MTELCAGAALAPVQMHVTLGYIAVIDNMI
jgi:hypothetical protein